MTLSAIEKERDGWRLEAESAIMEVAELRLQLAAYRAATNGDYWHYQGDGEDHPESLTCHVVMSAKQFRKLAEHKNAVETEQGRWQDEIYKALVRRCGANSKIDGGGCDSGDTLDVTLTEIHQALNTMKGDE